MWKSQMQSTVAMSTTEAEYIGLSLALRAAIPILRLINEMTKHVRTVARPNSSVACRVFEDNNFCIKVAESERVTHQTKHISVKYHHFKGYVARKQIKLRHVASEDQLADIFTKPLQPGLFKSLRKRLLGW